MLLAQGWLSWASSGAATQCFSLPKQQHGDVAGCLAWVSATGLSMPPGVAGGDSKSFFIAVISIVPAYIFIAYRKDNRTTVVISL